MLCSCCQEAEATSESIQHGYCLCSECQKTSFCAHCDEESAEEHFLWETAICEGCRRYGQQSQAIDELCQKVEELAQEHEWDFDGWEHSQSSRSRYLKIRRECDTCILGSDGDCTCERLTVRVSDHQSVYNREDVSLSADGWIDNGPKMRQLARLTDMLERRKGASC